METQISFIISFIISFFIFLYIAYKLLSRMAHDSGAESIWQWIKTLEINTEKWDHKVLFEWEYHPPVWIRILTGIIGAVLIGIILYVELTPGKQEYLIGLFYLSLYFLLFL